MGKETAKRLLRRGGEVWIVARNQARLAQAQAELAPDGPVRTTVVDLYDQSQVDAFIAQVQDEKRHLKYLVNTAGVFKPTPRFSPHTRADYDKYLDLNRSLFFITQAVAENMKRHGGGAMVNIGSMWGKQAIKATPSSAYSMAKAGLHAMTQHLAMELADDKEVADKNNMLWVPGCMTPSEIIRAENLGAKMIKLFPGNILGPAFMSAIKELFPRFIIYANWWR